MKAGIAATAAAPPHLLSFCGCKGEPFLQLVIDHEPSDSAIKVGSSLMRFRFPFHTSSELSERTRSLFSEYGSEQIALKSFFHLPVKRFIKNLRFIVPQETWEFDSLDLKACTLAERMVKEIKLAL